MPDPLPGTVIGDRYRLLARIGEGGMGTIYRAEHVYMRRALAIKLLDPELGQVDEICKRFTREAETCSQMSHPNIVQVSDFGRSSNGRLFLAMELILGESLAAALARNERFSLVRALDIGQQILSALDHAHGHGIVHRDLKPENVMLVGQFGKSDLVKLLDFGIAKISNPGRSEPNLTQAGAVFGTPEYMSPEQALGDTADARSDLYACGLLLYQMIAGVRPFSSPDPVRVLQMQILERERPLRAVAPDPLRPASIDAAIERALQKDPAQRFASAAEMAAALVSARRTLGARSHRALPALRRIQDVSGRLARLLQLTWTTRLIPRLRHVSAIASTRFRSLSPRARGGLIAAAGAAFVLVAVGLVLSRQPSPQPPAVQSSATMTEADVVRSIEDEVRRGRSGSARVLVSSALADRPASARLHLLSGSVDFLERRVEAGLLSYRAALRFDWSLGADPALLENAAAAVREGEFTTLAMRVLEDAGPAACATLADLALSERGNSRRAARKVCRRLSCDSPCATVQESSGLRARPATRDMNERPMFAR